MEITASNIYWITRLDALEGLFILLSAVGTIVLGVSGFVAFMAFLDEDERVLGNMKKIMKFSIPALAIGLLGCFLVPNTEEAAAMWVVPKVVNCESLPTVGTNVLHIIDTSIDRLKEKRSGKR